MNVCDTCKHAEWQYGPKGKASKTMPGKCCFLATQFLPKCVDITPFQIDIWYGQNYTTCPQFTPKEKAK